MALMYRLYLTLINIIFPPLTVLFLTGFGFDCLISCIFFLLAVIPSHIHGFYLSCTYFHRRRKVAKGRWPGGPKFLIESPNILNGGASDAEVARLYRKEHGGGRGASSSSDDEKEALRREKSNRKGGSKRGSRRTDQQSGYYQNQGGYGAGGGSRPPSRAGSARGSVRQSQRMSNGYAPQGYGYVNGAGGGVPSRAGSQRVSYPPQQRMGSQRVPQRAGSLNTRAGIQSGYGSAPVSPVVGSTAPLARNASVRSTAGPPAMPSRPPSGVVR